MLNAFICYTNYSVTVNNGRGISKNGIFFENLCKIFKTYFFGNDVEFSCRGYPLYPF